MDEIRKGYPGIFKRCLETRMCFIHDANPDSIWDASEAERQALWEHLYAQPGFGLWLSNYKEMLIEDDANKLATDFVAKKIRQRVNDPETADTLIPKNHGFGTRRVPMETFYYEAYNRPNVRLIDLNKTPIEGVTEKGLKTSGEDFEFDMLIYATGFDAVTGAFDAIDFRGVDGKRLFDKWSDGPRTYLGMTVQDFPNMFMVYYCDAETPSSLMADFKLDYGTASSIREHSTQYRARSRLGVQLYRVPRSKQHISNRAYFEGRAGVDGTCARDIERVPNQQCGLLE